MSEQAFRIEITGNIKVYIPIKKQAEVIEYTDWFNKEWEDIKEAA